MFETIRGQDRAVQQMQNALARPVNTYVFYGAKGTFTDEGALLFASRLIAEDGSNDDRVVKGFHSDVVEFFPSGVNYKVKEDVRDGMIAELRKSPIEGTRKVLIVHDADLLRSDSANTLLKSLEEPPENFFWILIAPSSDSLISTIKSRSFAIHFDRLEESLIESILIEEGCNPEKAKIATSLSTKRLDRARNISNFYLPLYENAKYIVDNHNRGAGAVINSVNRILECFDEVSSDIVAKNKLELDELKKEMKDSGYSEKVAKSIISKAKNSLETIEKKMRKEMLNEFLDFLDVEFSKKPAFIAAHDVINEYKSRLVYNPNETLFLESLLASIYLRQLAVNS